MPEIGLTSSLGPCKSAQQFTISFAYKVEKVDNNQSQKFLAYENLLAMHKTTEVDALLEEARRETDNR